MVNIRDIKSEECTQKIRAVKDTLDIFSGKWKLLIIGTLLINGTMRFNELKKALCGIAPKKLSKDLQELEMMIESMIDWGLNYRNNIK